MDERKFPMSGSLLGDNDWVASPRCEFPTEHERKLIENRKNIVVYGYVEDAEANYSYDDFALVSLYENYYLLCTSGCSCPSPSETWGIGMGPGNLMDLLKMLVDNRASGACYGVTKRQFDEFLAIFATAFLAAAKGGE